MLYGRQPSLGAERKHPILGRRQDQLIQAGSTAAATTKGWVRIEGKDYVMQDGDVVEFSFNV